GGQGHGFHPASHDDIGVTGQDCLRAVLDGLQAGPADHVEGPGGDLVGDAGDDGGLAGGVLAEAGLQDVAHDDLVDLVGGDPGPCDGFLDDKGPECYGRGLSQTTADRTDRGAYCADDDNFSHDEPHISADWMKLQPVKSKSV